MAVLACVPRKTLHSRRESKRQHAVQLAASEDTEGRLVGMVCSLEGQEPCATQVVVCMTTIYVCFGVLLGEAASITKTMKSMFCGLSVR